MTEKDLNRLDWLRRQRTALKSDKQVAAAKLLDYKVTGVVQGSRKEEPYNLHPVVLQGLPDNPDTRAATSQWAKVCADLARIEQQIQELEEFIRCVEDPVARDVMARHWIRGETWAGISTRMGKEASWAFKVAKRYLSKKF